MRKPGRSGVSAEAINLAGPSVEQQPSSLSRFGGENLSEENMNKRSTQGYVCMAALLTASSASPQSLPNLFPLPNGNGLLQTYNTNNAPISLKGAFFQSLGTNGRSCSSCHLPTEGWSVSAAEIQLRFLLTQGLDPIFRTNDGSNCDQNINTSTLEGRRKAYSLLLSRGLIRIPLAMPAGAEFSVASVQNPYGCSDTSTLSMYRRPLPATNLTFLSALMWDGRESTPLRRRRSPTPTPGNCWPTLRSKPSMPQPFTPRVQLRRPRKSRTL